MSLGQTIERFRAMGYEPSEPEYTGHGVYRVTMPAKLSAGTLTVHVESHGNWHAPGFRDKTQTTGSET